MMRQKIVCAIVFLLAGTNSFAENASLDAQIKKNVDDASKTFEKLMNKEPPHLWIHVRNKEQEEMLKNLGVFLKPIRLLKIEPIQVVKEGPKKSRLRFFSSKDEQDANLLLKPLKKLFPNLELQNLSKEYEEIGWVKQGYYELWLAPDVKQIITEPPEQEKTVPPSQNLAPPAAIAPAPAKP